MAICDDPGRIALVNGRIRYESQVYGRWDVEASCVAVIGECAIESPPELVGRFLVLVLENCSWYEVPENSRGMNLMIEHIERRFDCTFEFALSDGAAFESRVVAPAALRGVALFHYEIIPGKWWHWLFGAPKIRSKLSESVLAFLDKRRGHATTSQPGCS